MTRQLALALLLMSASLALGFAVRRAFLEREATEPAALAQPTAAQPAPSTLTVSHLEGRVELRDPDGGGWMPLAADAKVSERDSVRTDHDARAVLVAGDGLQVEVSAQSQVELTDIQGDQAKLLVERGRLSARVGGDARTLQVGVQGTDAIVQTQHASFSVLRDEHAQVAVAVTDGDVAVTAQRSQVKVLAGQQSVVAVDRPPAAPIRIPTSLFLKVARSGPSHINQRSTEVGGETTPGAVVLVNGVPAKTDLQGRFSAKIELKEGKNALQITARDVLGRSEQQLLPAVVVDTEPPKLQGKTVW
ncbi:MAG: FecR domain-containing protein [Polyangiales bacterium]